MSVPAWKLLLCPCGNDAKLFYNGEEVPMQGYTYEFFRNGRVEFIVTIYGQQIKLKDYYIAQYKEVPYNDGLDPQPKKV